jgi:ABC-2 type transport system permease protein
MRRILVLFRKELKTGLRDSMIVYILIAPFILALILKAVSTSVSATTINIAVDETVSEETSAILSEYAEVSIYGSKDEITKRIGDSDDVFGLTMEGDRFIIISQGDEMERSAELLEGIINHISNLETPKAIDVTVTDIGWKLSPMSQYGGSLLAVFVSVFGGMVILIGLVQEKQEKTITALNVSPIRKTELAAGKAALGFLFPLLQVVGVIALMGYEKIDYMMVIVVTISIALISVIVGFVIGANNDNVIGAIAGMKILFVPILASVFGAILLKESLQFLLYWSPFYWAFKAMNKIVLNEATWPLVASYSGIILAITCAVFLLLRKKIQHGLV